MKSLNPALALIVALCLSGAADPLASLTAGRNESSNEHRQDSSVPARQETTEAKERVTSRIEKTDAGDVVVIQEVTLEAPIAKVWAAYSTTAGWQAWVAPVAEVDFRTGGTIRTTYDPGGSVEDPNAIVLHVINFVPMKVITLQAEVSDRWPEILKAQEKQLFNVVIFESLDNQRTRVVSCGTGYRDSPEFDRLIEFIIPANEQTLANLIDYVERGKSAWAK